MVVTTFSLGWSPGGRGFASAEEMKLALKKKQIQLNISDIDRDNCLTTSGEAHPLFLKTTDPKNILKDHSVRTLPV
jgi:hypothetical protein